MSHTPEHAIRKWLAGFRPNLCGHQHGPLRFRTLSETVRLLKGREPPPRQLSYVTADADSGLRGKEHWHWTARTVEDAGKGVALVRLWGFVDA